MAATPGPMTAAELLRLPDDALRHELVRGEFRTAPLRGWREGVLISVLDCSLGTWTGADEVGTVVVGVGFVLARGPDTIRAPAIAVVVRERLGLLSDPDDYFPGAPDLAVEIISPNDLYTEVDEKVAEWLEHGTQVVFVINPRRRTVAVHRPGQPVSILGVADVLSAEDVVPGWSLPVRELFEDL